MSNVIEMFPGQPPKHELADGKRIRKPSRYVLTGEELVGAERALGEMVRSIGGTSIKPELLEFEAGEKTSADALVTTMGGVISHGPEDYKRIAPFAVEMDLGEEAEEFRPFVGFTGVDSAGRITEISERIMQATNTVLEGLDSSLRLPE